MAFIYSDQLLIAAANDDVGGDDDDHHAHDHLDDFLGFVFVSQTCVYKESSFLNSVFFLYRK